MVKFVTAGRQFKAPLKKDKDLDAHQVRLSCSKPHITFFKYLASRSLSQNLHLKSFTKTLRHAQNLHRR